MSGEVSASRLMPKLIAADRDGVIDIVFQEEEVGGQAAGRPGGPVRGAAAAAAFFDDRLFMRQ